MNAGIPEFLVFFAIAFTASVAGAISGIGGGIIIKPALDALSGLQITQINFLSGTTVLVMALVSLLRSAGEKKGNGVKLEGRRGTSLALGAVLGGMSGKTIFSLAVRGFDPEIIGVSQCLILIFLTVTVLIYTLKKDTLVPKNIQNLPFCFFLGMGIGALSAFLGIGGGPVNIMAISFFLAMDIKTTALHSLYTVFLSQLAGFLLSAVSGGIPPVSPEFLAAMIAGGIFGGLLGSVFFRKLKNEQAAAVFRVVLVVVILVAGYNGYNGTRHLY